MFTIGNDKFEAEFHSLPESTQQALAQQGFNHKMQNEVAAKISADANKQAVINVKARLGDKATKDELASLVPVERKALLEALSDDDRAAITAQYQSDLWAKMLAGTLGTVERARKGDPFDAEGDKIAFGEVVEILRANKLWTERKHPSRDAEISFAKGPRTVASLVEQRLANHESRIHKEANRRLDAVRKAKEAAEKAAQARGETPADADALI